MANRKGPSIWSMFMVFRTEKDRKSRNEEYLDLYLKLEKLFELFPLAGGKSSTLLMACCDVV